MQNCCKLMFGQLRILNNILVNRSLSNILVTRKQILPNEVYFGSNTLLKCIGTQNISTPNVSVTLKLKQKTVVSSINDLIQYINSGKQVYLKLLTNIWDTIDFENISNTNAQLLLECCGKSVADSSLQARNNICQDVYKNLLKYNKLDLDIYHTYIKVCTDNNVVLNINQFLSSLKFEPTKETYILLLNNACESGHIKQALELLEIMKTKNISVDEEVFNSLVLAHSFRGGVTPGELVLQTMKAAQVPETTETKFSFLKGISKRDSFDDFVNVWQKHPFDMTETHLLELVEILGLNDKTSWLPKIRNLYSNITISREFIALLEKCCIHLVHMDKSESAMAIYEEFVKPSSNKNYGFFLLREMLHCNVDIDRIISLAKHLQDDNLNENILENLTAIALKHNYTDASWKLLETLPVLRPHFFWPLLVNARAKYGEAGIFDVLKRMAKMGVKVDAETLQLYVLLFCNLDSTKLLIKKFQDLLDLTVKEVLSPILTILLQNNQAKSAANLCNVYNVNIYGNKLFNLLSTTWYATKDTKSVVLLLQRYCESNENDDDLVGEFLHRTLSACKSDDDFIQYLNLIALICLRNLRIKTTSAETLHNLCLNRCQNKDVADKIRDNINALLDFGLNTKQETSLIPHPRDMNIEELECHLVELLEKNMETRGLLRKLIQLHANRGNLEMVENLREKFLNAGYTETVGMKSSLMHSYVKGGYFEYALEIYKAIKDTNPNFKIDDFKILDLATVLIKQNQFDEAMHILRTETESKKPLGGTVIEKNCWQLLGSFEKEDEQLQMFNFLVENNYCKPTNNILGPLVRTHLKRGDLQKTADAYIQYATKYKHTPLQLEVIRAILKVEDEALLQRVLSATARVHGSVPTQTVLIAALAENGQEKPIRKLFANNRILVKKELERRCERWVHEGKLEPLRTLANACQRIPKEVFDVNFVFNCILQIYSVNNDYNGAVALYEELLEKDVSLDEKLRVKLNDLLKRCKFGETNVKIL